MTFKNITMLLFLQKIINTFNVRESDLKKTTMHDLNKVNWNSVELKMSKTLAL